jgi:hypothetical protein
MKKQAEKSLLGLGLERCEAITKSGRQCRNGRLSGSRHCFSHAGDPKTAKKRAEARRRGGRNAHHSSDSGERPEITLRETEDVLRILEGAVADVLVQPPSIHRAKSLAQLSGVALKALEALKTEHREAALERSFPTLSGLPPWSN